MFQDQIVLKLFSKNYKISNFRRAQTKADRLVVRGRRKYRHSGEKQTKHKEAAQFEHENNWHGTALKVALQLKRKKKRMNDFNIEL